MALNHITFNDNNERIDEIELKREFEGINCISDTDIKEELSKCDYFNKFSLNLIKVNQKLIFALTNNHKNETEIIQLIYTIKNMANDLFKNHKDYPYLRFIAEELIILFNIVNNIEKNKLYIYSPKKNLDYSEIDDIAIKLSWLENMYSIPTHLINIRSAKKNLYSKVSIQLNYEEANNDIETTFDLLNDSKLYKRTVGIIRLYNKKVTKDKYDRVPNAYLIAEDILIDTVKNYTGDIDINDAILDNVRKYIDSYNRKDYSKEDIAVRRYVNYLVDSWVNPEVMNNPKFLEVKKMIDELKLTSEQNKIINANNREYNDHGYKIQQLVLMLKDKKGRM